MTPQSASTASKDDIEPDSVIQKLPEDAQKLQGNPTTARMDEAAAEPSARKSGVSVDAAHHIGPEATQRTTRRRRSRSTGSQNEDTGLPGLLALLGEDEYELYEVAPGSGAKKIDTPPDMKSFRTRKHPFIIRRKTAQKIAQEKAQFIGGEPQVADGEVDQLDYEKRFRPDKPGERMAPNARVWRVYLNEAGQFDVDMVEKMMDTVDVILIIAALFAAIVTTLVALTAAALQLDQPKVTNMLLMELIDLQRAQMGNGSIDSIEHYPITADSPATETANWTDYVATRLWFASLALSMSTALIAMLVRQWIHSYDAPTFQGTAQKRAEIRHFRFYGFDAWNVPLIIDLLPTMLHLSLFLFFAGLVVYLHPLDRTIEILVAVLAAIVFMVYTVSNLLPVWYASCPYKTPLSRYSYSSLVWWMVRCRRLHKGTPITVQSLQKTLLQLIYSPLHLVMRLLRYLISHRNAWSLHTLFKPLSKLHSFMMIDKHPPSLKEKEITAIEAQEDKLHNRMFTWLMEISSNPSARSIITSCVALNPAEHLAAVLPFIRPIEWAKAVQYISDQPPLLGDVTSPKLQMLLDAASDLRVAHGEHEFNVALMDAGVLGFWRRILDRHHGAISQDVAQAFGRMMESYMDQHTRSHIFEHLTTVCMWEAMRSGSASVERISYLR